MNSLALTSLLRLTSPALPVGGFTYSQGLEYAHEAGWLRNADSAASWLQGVMQHAIAGLDIPVLIRCYASLEKNSLEKNALDQFIYWNDFSIAARETRELRLEDTQMGNALLKLLQDTHESLPCAPTRASWPAMFAMAAFMWRIPLADACTGFVWAWLENQLAAAAKIIPLGQTSVQRLLAQLSHNIDECVAHGMQVSDNDIGASLPGLALASMLHETQYTRLFRS